MHKEILKANKETIKAGLEKLLEGGPRWERVGICGNLIYDRVQPEFGTDALKVLFKGWPEHSGDRAYPVEGQEAYELGRATLWKDEGLRKRQSLIRHMLMKLEEL